MKNVFDNLKDAKKRCLEFTGPWENEWKITHVIKQVGEKYYVLKARADMIPKELRNHVHRA